MVSGLLCYLREVSSASRALARSSSGTDAKKSARGRRNACAAWIPLSALVTGAPIARTRAATASPQARAAREALETANKAEAIALPVTTIYEDPEFPLQVWVELFYDSLLDDGLERKGCRNYGEHRKIFEQTPKELELALGNKDLALALSAKAKEMADKAEDKAKAKAISARNKK